MVLPFSAGLAFFALGAFYYKEKKGEKKGKNKIILKQYKYIYKILKSYKINIINKIGLFTFGAAFFLVSTGVALGFCNKK